MTGFSANPRKASTMAATPEQTPGTPRNYPQDYCLATYGGYGACIMHPGHRGLHQDANGHTFTAGTPHAIFGVLTRRETCALMDLIGTAIQECCRMADILRDADTTMHRNLDVPHHETLCDLAELHSDLFAILCPDSPAAS